MKTKLTPEVQSKIVEALKKGNFIDVACNYAGVSSRVYHKWIKRGEDALETIDNDMDRINELDEYHCKCVHFIRLTREALTGIEMQLVDSVILDGKPKDHLRVLERRFPKRWNPVTESKPTFIVNFSEMLQAADEVKGLADGKEVKSNYKVEDD